jgi:Fe2+ or Zn2+ uptake regulation protein
MQVSQILICDNCGAKIEIEDSDEHLSFAESKVHDDENFQEIALCENCAQKSQNHNVD